MDFNHAKVDGRRACESRKLVNEKITENLSVTRREMPREDAENSGRNGVWAQVSAACVLRRTEINFFCRICGGPHVSASVELGTFKIIKEESVVPGIRRIYSTIE